MVGSSVFTWQVRQPIDFIEAWAWLCCTGAGGAVT